MYFVAICIIQDKIQTEIYSGNH